MATSLEFSTEQKTFCQLMRCPLCEAYPIVATYVQANGVIIPRDVKLQAMDRSALAQCPRCNQKWPVFAKYTTEAPSLSPTVTTLHATALPNVKAEIAGFEFLETDRMEEYIGSDRRIVDNSKGSGTITRTMAVSKEWTKSVTVDLEKAISTTGEAGFKAFIFDLKAKIDASLKHQYSVTEGTKHAYTDETSVAVGPREKNTYCLNWKRIWQNGLIRCLDRNNNEIGTIPFRVVIGLTYDLVTE
jgi:hypothetical protein